jgi:hypothetical protein
MHPGCLPTQLDALPNECFAMHTRAFNVAHALSHNQQYAFFSMYACKNVLGAPAQ